jgi:hypothetical protein
MNKNKHPLWIAATAFVASLAVVLPAFAAMPSAAANEWHGRAMMDNNNRAWGVFGTVSAVSGTTLTVTQRTMRPNTTTTPTVYTVNASNASVVKNGATSTVANIAVGDTVAIQGTISGTDITASMIRDGMGRSMPEGRGLWQRATSSTPASLIQGNGEPVIGGNVTSVNGEIVTITNASNATYTIDATNAKIVKNGATSTVSALAIGDGIIAQGTVNGTSVTAVSIIDQGIHVNSATSTATPPWHGFGFFGSIGNFFKHLFGF